LLDLPTRKYDHFDANLVFVEVDLQRLDELQPQNDDEYASKCALHHGVKILRGVDC
jgi:hypothetical protein